MVMLSVYLNGFQVFIIPSVSTSSTNLKNPTVKVVEQICNQLNISLSEFFSDSVPSVQEEDSLSLQITAQISDKTREEKQIILQVIKDVMKLCNVSKKHEPEKTEDI